MNEQNSFCCYCGQDLGRILDPDSDNAPAVDDDAAWAVEAQLHHSHCEWVETRAHQRGVEIPITPQLPLPPDPENMNDRRAAWAEYCLQEFLRNTGTEAEDMLCDLLCDLQHWCDRNGRDWAIELTRAEVHYRQETTPLNPPAA
jgi:hypothetical protein